MTNNSIRLTLPVGRMVQGNLYAPNTHGMNGELLTYKKGKQAGQARKEYWFIVAIPKGAETHWAHTEWGKQIWQFGNQAYPKVAEGPLFSWKISDGDSTVPNKNGTIPCENEGWAKHWIVRFKGNVAPKICNHDGKEYLHEIDAVVAGFYVQVCCDISANDGQTPGIYINPLLVALSGYGNRIITGIPDAGAVGFGNSPLPVGASKTPLSQDIAVTGPATVGTQIATPVSVTPHTNILMPPAPAMPVVVSAPPAPAKRMTAAAVGTYEAYIAAGWTDALLVQHGFMEP